MTSPQHIFTAQVSQACFYEWNKSYFYSFLWCLERCYFGGLRKCLCSCVSLCVMVRLESNVWPREVIGHIAAKCQDL